MKKPTRRVTYSPETVESLCAKIEELGIETRAVEAIGASQSSYYGWKRKYPDFAERVEAALNRFSEKASAEQKALANKSLQDYLSGEAVEIWETLEEGVDGEGRRWERRALRTIKRPPPHWAIKRVLGPMPELDVLGALRVLAVAGILPNSVLEEAANAVSRITAELAERISKKLGSGKNDEYQQRSGISAETATAIRKLILGGATLDTTAISTEMDE